MLAPEHQAAGQTAGGGPLCPDLPNGLELTDTPITPTDIATAVNDMFHRYGALPIASDMGDCLFYGHGTWNTPNWWRRATTPPWATGVPSGLGVQAATGRRPLILVGDGAFQMTGMELLNCSRYGWNPIVLVFNNSSWEMLRAFQPESAFNDLDKLDYAALANTLGGRGHSAATKKELHHALEQAFKDVSCFPTDRHQPGARPDVQHPEPLRSRLQGDAE